MHTALTILLILYFLFAGLWLVCRLILLYLKFRNWLLTRKINRLEEILKINEQLKQHNKTYRPNDDF